MLLTHQNFMCINNSHLLKLYNSAYTQSFPALVFDVHEGRQHSVIYATQLPCILCDSSQFPCVWPGPGHQSRHFPVDYYHQTCLSYIQVGVGHMQYACKASQISKARFTYPKLLQWESILLHIFRFGSIFQFQAISNKSLLANLPGLGFPIPI